MKKVQSCWESSTVFGRHPKKRRTSGITSLSVVCGCPKNIHMKTRCTPAFTIQSQYRCPSLYATFISAIIAIGSWSIFWVILNPIYSHPWFLLFIKNLSTAYNDGYLWCCQCKGRIEIEEKFGSRTRVSSFTLCS